MITEEQEKKHSNRGLIISIGFHVAVLVLFLFFGFTKLDPMPAGDETLPIAFGFNDVGSGNTPDLPANSDPVKKNTTESEQVENNDEVLTNNDSEITVDDKKHEEKSDNKKTEENKKDKEVVDAESEEERKLRELKEKMKNPYDKNGNNGDDNKDGSKGKEDGIDKGKDDGKHGTDDGTVTQLGSKTIKKGKSDCTETGIQYVLITFDGSGKILKVEGNQKGSTNNDPCLKKRAEELAKTGSYESGIFKGLLKCVFDF